MFSSNVFNYINVLDKAADASWQRHDLISNNLANGDTPGFKRQDIAFEAQLKKAIGRNSSTDNLDFRIDKVNGKLGRLNAKSYTDMANFSYRIDGNNVDVENENVMLAENQIKYQGLIDSINQEFMNLQTAMK